MYENQNIFAQIKEMNEKMLWYIMKALAWGLLYGSSHSDQDIKYKTITGVTFFAFSLLLDYGWDYLETKINKK